MIKGAKPLLLVGAMGLAVLTYACTMRDITGVEGGEVLVSPFSAKLLEGEALRFTAQARDVLGNPFQVGAVTWSNDDPSARAVGADGTVQGLQAGQTLVWATLDGVRGSASVVVAPGPTIAAEPASLSFQASFEGPSPNPVQVRITNAGGGALEGLAATVEHPAGSPTGWVTLSLTGFTAPTDLPVSAITGPLSSGTYSATVRVAAQGARNSPVCIPLELEISLDQPVIALSASSLEFQMEAGGPAPAPRTMQVTNVGGGTLTGLQALASGGWLSASPSSSSAPAQLLVQVNPTGVTEGTYQGGVVVRSSLSGVQNQSVNMTLTVVTPPSADLRLTKSGPSTAFVGDTVVFVLIVTNGGPDEARNTTLLDALPVGVAFISATGGGVLEGERVVWKLGTPGVGIQMVDTVTVVIESTGLLVNLAGVTSSTPDPNSANNSATHTTTVNPGPAAKYLVTTSASSPFAGSSVTITDQLEDAIDNLFSIPGVVVTGANVEELAAAVEQVADTTHTTSYTLANTADLEAAVHG